MPGHCTGSRDAVRGRWLGYFEDLRPFRGILLDDGLVDEVEQRARDFLAGRQPLFEHRIAEGRILDGHGDLLADDILTLEDGPRLLDCLDFDDQLRWLDGLDDVCCLAMDLKTSVGRTSPTVWARAAHREPAARGAERTSSELVALWCTVPHEVAAQRMRDRTGGVSDADEDVASAMGAEADPWPEAHSLSTAEPPERVVDRALSLVDAGCRR